MSIFDRAGLRARVAAASKDEVVLEEMRRHGFWPERQETPTLPEALIERQGEIRRELETLATDASAYEDRDRALKRVQKERMIAARERRKETKLKNAQQRYDRATQWHARQDKEITHLGDNVSAALHGAPGRPELIATYKLPALADPPALATAMGIPIGELRFLAYDRAVAKVDHYARFTLPKKSGGVREIAAPMPRLKRSQYWILHNILQKLPGHDASHGFRSGRSIVTNATPHAGKRVVINIDFKDFFPTISYPRVKGLFVALGYPEKIAAPLALLCTDAERDKVEIDGRTWSIARETRRLPQGAPTSPAIANIIADRLDRRMIGAARKLGFAYTRYADDMTFSGAAPPGSNAVNRMIWQARQIAEDEGFVFNDAKTRVMGSGTRQDVTGLVVNERPAVSRAERRRFRAWLHNAETAASTRGELPAWTNGKGVASDALGFVSYLAMIDPAAGAALVARTKAVVRGDKPAPRKAHLAPATAATKDRRSEFRKASAEGRTPADKWWTPAAREKPKLEPIETPKTGQQARLAADNAAAGTSVPPIAGSAGTTRTPATQRRPSISATGRQPSAPSGSAEAKSPPSLMASLALSFAALMLAGIPAIGPFAAFVALGYIWSRYVRGRRGG